MTEYDAGIVDVFADEALRGNPLAVVEHADDLSEETMRRIAGEFNQAETTFLMKSSRADWKLMSFTANGSPVYGAGHNALGAWLWLAYMGRLGDLNTPKTFQQEIGDAVLPITMEKRNDRFFGTMTQGPLVLGAPLEDVTTLETALGLGRGAVLQDPPVRTADTGAGHLMVRVKDRKTVDAAKPDAAELLKVLRFAGAEGCYVFSFDEKKPETAYARFFNPTVGLWEDSATGTAAGPLAAYLDRVGKLGPDRALLIEQGTRMGRQSFLPIRLDSAPQLSGTGVVVMQGRLKL
ncbi:PhzF family phenazine biosynthesis protein [Sulfitobacter porphyrae]|uniref:PhzF family phenazine biosynthesis protein n=1 Tax=Sulfitobacter porphyrae TaxID=1246864 RepID=A0ABW2B9R8_9RHOB|nr:epimerase [Sulfitobacter porphyrae]